MNIKLIFLRIILILLLTETFCIIFGFSNQNGEKSGSISKNITNIITKNIVKNMESTQKDIFLNRAEKIVRKLAHFSLYTIVGILLMSFISTYDLSFKVRFIFSILFGVMYAISDEIHQSFIPDRMPSIFDVIIDSAGVFMGIIGIYICLKYAKKKMKGGNISMHNTNITI